MKKKIIIVHGWMHSAKIYEKLKIELEKDDANVELFELPGFGKKKSICYKNVIETYVNDLKKYIEDNEFNIVIGHSLGGNILLRVANILNDKKTYILLSPEYYGIKMLKLLTPFLNFGVKVLEWLKNENVFTTLIIKIFSLFTINSWGCITNDVVTAARQADPKVAVELIKEMRDDKWRSIDISSDVYLITSEKDRIITKNKMSILKNDIKNIKSIEIKNIGHTAVLEDFNSLLSNIKNIMERL